MQLQIMVGRIGAHFFKTYFFWFELESQKYSYIELSTYRTKIDGGNAFFVCLAVQGDVPGEGYNVDKKVWTSEAAS